MTEGSSPPKNKNRQAADGFLAEHGYGPDRLAALFARIDWLAPGALARAHDALALFIDTIAELLLADARARRQSAGARLNALAGSNAPAERPLLGLALARLERSGPLKGLLTRHRDALQAAAATLPAHARLLRDGTLPAARIADLAAIDPDTERTLLAREWLAAGASPAVTLRLLKHVAQDNPPRRQLATRLAASRRLLSYAGGSLALDYRAFRTLPAPVREALLFTPALTRAFLDPQAQAAARPPSPDFDPLFLDHALRELRQGRLSHVDLDTLFLGAATPAFRARIVAALAEGSGDLACDADVRERLIAGADQPELCLLACAAATSPRELQRALASLPALPAKGVLGEALYGFTRIAFHDALPPDVPAALLARADFARDMLEDSARQLAAWLGDDTSRASGAAAFRHFVAWLRYVESARRPRESAAHVSLASLLAAQGHRLATEIGGNEWHALHLAGDTGVRLAAALAQSIRAQHPARWVHGYLTRIIDLDPALARTLAGDDATPAERALLDGGAAA